MRNYNLLWGLWAVWALLVVIWFIDIYLDLPALDYGQLLAAILGAGIVVLMVFFYNFKRSNPMFSFDKRKKSVEEPQESSEISNPPELVNSVSPVRVKKDTFIAQGTQLTGKVAADGNITVEGHIEGDVQCENTIRVEHIGKVKGEMKSQQIVINGYVEGRIYAHTVTILAQGKMVGDIFSDELSIEKGGIFLGQSNQLKQGQHSQETLAYAEKADDLIEGGNIMALVENNPSA